MSAHKFAARIWKLVDSALRYRYYFAYSILAFLVIWAWWANVISVYFAKSRGASGADGIINEQALSVGTQKIVVLTCQFELYEVPSTCLFKPLCGCSYWLPVSVLAWRRLGYKALVFIVGPTQGESSWRRRTSYLFILDLIKRFGGVQVEEISLDQESLIKTTVSMIPLFAAKFVRFGGDPYIIYSEVNFIPLSENFFQPTNDRKNGIVIVATKLRCCRRFLLSGNVIKLLPAGAMVGMLSSTWRDVLNVDSPPPSSNTTTNKYAAQSMFDSFLEIKRLHEKYISRRNLNQIQAAPDKLILSILINQWLRSKGDIATGIEKELLTIRHPQNQATNQKEGTENAENEDGGGNLFREFTLTAQTISGWSEVYPVVAELFNPTWLDLTEYWINYTNIVNSEPNIHRRWNTGVTPSLLSNGIHFLPLLMTPPAESDDHQDDEVIGNYGDKQEDFQYVAFFDEDED